MFTHNTCDIFVEWKNINKTLQVFRFKTGFYQYIVELSFDVHVYSRCSNINRRNCRGCIINNTMPLQRIL